MDRSESRISGRTDAQKHKSPLRAGFFMCYKFATARGGSLAGQALSLSFHPLNYGESHIRAFAQKKANRTAVWTARRV